ncbi:putative Structural maintenance of chromosomes protein 2 [Blattamonas nauphoetae]|uniref:Structural maintenance of chromosomes protein 2 n=1 Tax=Blattamonas nauphoetae TaxID=2049346 RepID=A0ABQ9X3X6_9EUKA|nr:putative Structural maintenance of chromosomes protein 2 [Blattamonas nauphoetae]
MAMDPQSLLESILNRVLLHSDKQASDSISTLYNQAIGDPHSFIAHSLTYLERHSTDPSLLEVIQILLSVLDTVLDQRHTILPPPNSRPPLESKLSLFSSLQYLVETVTTQKNAKNIGPLFVALNDVINHIQFDACACILSLLKTFPTSHHIARIFDTIFFILFSQSIPNATNISIRGDSETSTDSTTFVDEIGAENQIPLLASIPQSHVVVTATQHETALVLLRNCIVIASSRSALPLVTVLLTSSSLPYHIFGCNLIQALSEVISPSSSACLVASFTLLTQSLQSLLFNQKSWTSSNLTSNQGASVPIDSVDGDEEDETETTPTIPSDSTTPSFHDQLVGLCLTSLLQSISSLSLIIPYQSLSKALSELTDTSEKILLRQLPVQLCAIVTDLHEVNTLSLLSVLYDRVTSHKSKHNKALGFTFPTPIVSSTSPSPIFTTLSDRYKQLLSVIVQSLFGSLDAAGLVLVLPPATTTIPIDGLLRQLPYLHRALRSFTLSSSSTYLESFTKLVELSVNVLTRTGFTETQLSSESSELRILSERPTQLNLDRFHALMVMFVGESVRTLSLYVSQIPKPQETLPPEHSPATEAQETHTSSHPLDSPLFNQPPSHLSLILPFGQSSESPAASPHAEMRFRTQMEHPSENVVSPINPVTPITPAYFHQLEREYAEHLQAPLVSVPSSEQSTSGASHRPLLLSASKHGRGSSHLTLDDDDCATQSFFSNSQVSFSHHTSSFYVMSPNVSLSSQMMSGFTGSSKSSIPTTELLNRPPFSDSEESEHEEVENTKTDAKPPSTDLKPSTHQDDSDFSSSISFSETGENENDPIHRDTSSETIDLSALQKQKEAMVHQWDHYSRLNQLSKQKRHSLDYTVSKLDDQTTRSLTHQGSVTQSTPMIHKGLEQPLQASPTVTSNDDSQPSDTVRSAVASFHNAPLVLSSPHSIAVLPSVQKKMDSLKPKHPYSSTPLLPSVYHPQLTSQPTISVTQFDSTGSDLTGSDDPHLPSSVSPQYETTSVSNRENQHSVSPDHTRLTSDNLPEKQEQVPENEHPSPTSPIHTPEQDVKKPPQLFTETTKDDSNFPELLSQFIQSSDLLQQFPFLIPFIRAVSDCFPPTSHDPNPILLLSACATWVIFSQSFPKRLFSPLLSYIIPHILTILQLVPVTNILTSESIPLSFFPSLSESFQSELTKPLSSFPPRLLTLSQASHPNPQTTKLLAPPSFPLPSLQQILFHNPTQILQSRTSIIVVNTFHLSAQIDLFSHLVTLTSSFTPFIVHYADCLAATICPFLSPSRPAKVRINSALILASVLRAYTHALNTPENEQERKRRRTLVKNGLRAKLSTNSKPKIRSSESLFSAHTPADCYPFKTSSLVNSVTTIFRSIALSLEDEDDPQVVCILSNTMSLSLHLFSTLFYFTYDDVFVIARLLNSIFERLFTRKSQLMDLPEWISPSLEDHLNQSTKQKNLLLQSISFLKTTHSTPPYISPGESSQRKRLDRKGLNDSTVLSTSIEHTSDYDEKTIELLGLIVFSFVKICNRVLPLIRTPSSTSSSIGSTEQPESHKLSQPSPLTPGHTRSRLQARQTPVSISPLSISPHNASPRDTRTKPEPTAPFPPTYPPSPRTGQSPRGQTRTTPGNSQTTNLQQAKNVMNSAMRLIIPHFIRIIHPSTPSTTKEVLVVMHTVSTLFPRLPNQSKFETISSFTPSLLALIRISNERLRLLSQQTFEFNPRTFSPDSTSSNVDSLKGLISLQSSLRSALNNESYANTRQRLDNINIIINACYALSVCCQISVGQLTSAVAPFILDIVMMMITLLKYVQHCRRERQLVRKRRGARTWTDAIQEKEYNPTDGRSELISLKSGTSTQKKTPSSEELDEMIKLAEESLEGAVGVCLARIVMYHLNSVPLKLQSICLKEWVYTLPFLSDYPYIPQTSSNDYSSAFFSEAQMQHHLLVKVLKKRTDLLFYADSQDNKGTPREQDDCHPGGDVDKDGPTPFDRDFIRHLLMTGFKSYKERTEIKGFDPLFNAITGLNGSGKSNVLDAICFVLGISNLQQVRANSFSELIYKQGQTKIQTAIVTIFFDNTDKTQCPTGYEHCDEIVVTRQLQINGKSKYFLNGRTANPTTVANMYQSVSLNIHNPHFLIMQGKITKVLNMKPLEILGMIEEAAGTRLYESKKVSAVRTLERKEKKVSELKEVLENQIQPKLERLKKDEEAFNEWEHIRRYVDELEKQYVIYQYLTLEKRRRDEVEQKRQAEESNLVDLQREIDTLTTSIDSLRQEASATAIDIATQLGFDIQEYLPQREEGGKKKEKGKKSKQTPQEDEEQKSPEEQTFETLLAIFAPQKSRYAKETEKSGTKTGALRLSEELKKVIEERNDAANEVTKTRQALKDYEDDLKLKITALETKKHEKIDRERAIQSLHQQVQELTTHYEEEKKRYEELTLTIRTAQESGGGDDGKEDAVLQTLQTELRNMQERLNQFQEERARFNDIHVNAYQTTIARLRTEQEKNKKEKQKREQEATEKAQEISRLEAELQEYTNAYGQHKYDEEKHREIHNQYEATRREIENLRHQADSFGQSLSHVLSPTLPLPDDLKGRGKGVHGLAINLFEAVSEEYAHALETIAKGKMFSIIVDDDQIGKKIINHISASRNRRRYTIIPLTKISSPFNDEPVEDRRRRADQLAQECHVRFCRHAVDLVTFADPMRKAIEYVFGTTLVTETLEDATRLVNRMVENSNQRRNIRGFPCRVVSLDGSIVDPAGLMTGGAARNENEGTTLRKLAQYHKLTKDLSNKQSDQNIIVTSLNKLEAERKKKMKIEEDLELARQDLTYLEQGGNVAELRNQIERVEQQLQDAQLRLNEMDDRIHAMQTQQIPQLQKMVQTMTHEKEDVHHQAMDEVKRKKAKEDEVKKVLKTLRNGVNDTQTQVEKKTRDITEQEVILHEEIEKSIENIEQDILRLKASIEKHTQDLTQKLIPILTVLEKRQEEAKEKDKKVKEIYEKLSSTKATIHSYREEISQKEVSILKKTLEKQKTEDEERRLLDQAKRLMQQNSWMKSELRQMSQEQKEQYEQMNGEDMQTDLDRQRGDEEVLSRKVNKKAVGMSQKTQHEFDELVKKKKIVEDDKGKIEAAMTELDEKKKELLKTTWQKVNMDFGDIFSKLLPGARAKLVLAGPPGSAVEDCGLEVKVAFGDFWKESLSELSGGQRSLLALSLILALLLFKPAPMYILDEIDAALDLSHTENIGRIIRETFKGKSQFIIVSLKEGMFQNANMLFHVKFVNGESVVKREEGRRRQALPATQTKKQTMIEEVDGDELKPGKRRRLE